MNNDSGFPENSRPLDFVFLLPKGVGCTIMPYKERQALLERLRDCITTANFSSFTFATYVTTVTYRKLSKAQLGQTRSSFTAKGILERLGVQTLSSFVKIR